MEIKKLLYLALIFNTISYAQKLEQRVEIQKTHKVSELNSLKTKFQTKYEQDEKKVLEYLINHPTEKRTEIKNGSVYHIKSIDSNGNPVYINTKSNIESGELIKANSLYNGGSIGANITGTGMVVGIWDGGQVRATHELLVGKAVMQSGQTLQSKNGNDHMTHVTGTIVGKDINNSARGIAYNATSKNYDWDNDLAEMTAFAADGYLISNHSYGMSNEPTQAQWTFGAYNDTAKSWDALLKTTPNYLPFVAIGNEQKSNGSGKTGTNLGYDVVTGSAASKNVVTVGGVNADRSISDYTNFGPTDDGRIKPDICARGTGINSSITDSNTAYSGSGLDSSGTSYASPAAAASALLLQQYYYSLNNSYMSASMLKALLLHSADDAGPVGPDLKFGWGILNIEKAAQIIKDVNSKGKARMYTFTVNPTNNSSSEISINGSGTTNANVGVGVGELKASICWTDDDGNEQLATEGVDPTKSRLVYNFDIKLRRVSPFAQTSTYKSFTMATKTNLAQLGTDWFQNNVDNFKQTYIPAGGTEGGSYVLYLRKFVSSPSAPRNVSVIITGLATNTTTLTNTDFNENTATLFFSATDDKIKLISNKISSFGEYEIYDVSGKQVDKGFSSSNEILFNSAPKGIYFMKFTNEEIPIKFKFVK